MVCTPGNWHAPPPTTKLAGNYPCHDVRSSTEGRGAGRDGYDIRAAIDARQRNGKPRRVDPGAHVAVRHLLAALVGESDRAAARGFGADLSRTTLTTAPVPERIH